MPHEIVLALHVSELRRRCNTASWHRASGAHIHHRCKPPEHPSRPPVPRCYGRGTASQPCPAFKHSTIRCQTGSVPPSLIREESSAIFTFSYRQQHTKLLKEEKNLKRTSFVLQQKAQNKRGYNPISFRSRCSTLETNLTTSKKNVGEKKKRKLHSKVISYYERTLNTRTRERDNP